VLIPEYFTRNSLFLNTLRKTGGDGTDRGGSKQSTSSFQTKRFMLARLRFLNKGAGSSSGSEQRMTSSEQRPTTPESGIIEGNSPGERRKTSNGSSRIPDVDSGLLRSAPEAGRTQALSARAHARAAVPLQPGLRRMRQDPVPRPHSEERSLCRRLLESGR